MGIETALGEDVEFLGLGGGGRREGTSNVII